MGDNYKLIFHANNQEPPLIFMQTHIGCTKNWGQHVGALLEEEGHCWKVPHAPSLEEQHNDKEVARGDLWGTCC